MSKAIITESNLTAIANAIRQKAGVQTTYTPSEMATAITNLPTGGGSFQSGIYAENGYIYLSPHAGAGGINGTTIMLSLIRR